MKRVPQLRDLSEDHHHGLVLARKAKMVASGQEGPSGPEMWAEVETRFKTELEPHFEIEEAFIGKVLGAVGDPQLAQRLSDEHAALRRFLSPGHGRTLDDLRRFGELLEQHIRFEERELFQVAQDRLTSDELAAVANACRDRRDNDRGTAARAGGRSVKHHPVIHFEIGCHRGEKTRDFFAELFGWEVSGRDAGMVIDTGGAGDIRGHIVELAPEWGTYVTVYVEVEDLEAYLEKANELGGRTLVPPVTLPGKGSFAWLAAPEGNIIGIWKSE